jgi:hypothetical protein
MVSSMNGPMLPQHLTGIQPAANLTAKSAQVTQYGQHSRCPHTALPPSLPLHCSAGPARPMPPGACCRSIQTPAQANSSNNEAKPYQPTTHREKSSNSEYQRQQHACQLPLLQLMDASGHQHARRWLVDNTVCGDVPSASRQHCCV